MKKIKKLLAFALAMVMCLGMAVTVSAAQGDPGHIVIENATPNTTYKAYKLFDANPAPTTGNQTTTQVAYTASAAVKAWFEGKGADNPFDFTPTANANVFNVSKKSGKTNADVTNFLNGLYTKSGDNYSFADGFEATFTPETAQADANGDVNFGAIPYGYYLITSGLGAIVTVSSTNPTATVIDKNVSKPTLDSKVIVKDGSTTTKDSVNYGDTVSFKVEITSSNYDGAELVTKYVVKDTLDAGMTYMPTTGVTVVVTVGGTPLTEVPANPGEGEFKVDRTPTGLAEGKTGFEIEIPWATGQTDADGNIIASTIDAYYAQGDKIEVTYSAKVTSTAALGHPLKNEATFDYFTNNTSDPKTPDDPKKETETTTYGFDLVKTDDSKVILSGAEFSLFHSQTGGDAIQFVAETVNDEVVAYHVATPEEIEDSTVTKTTTISAGNVKVKGLKGGTITTTTGENGTVTETVAPEVYWLEETKAPAGYNRLDARQQVSIGNENLFAIMNGNDYGSNGVQVVNTAGQLLPSTGGIGTTIFYVVGGILVVAAGILLITRKRMSKEQ